MTVMVDTPAIDAIASGSHARAALEETSMRAEQLMRPYVPVDENILRPSAQMNSRFAAGELVWNTPYAAKQYYVPMNHTDPAGLATDHWDEKMLADKGDELTGYAGQAYMRGL